jgi:predicted alpha-1,2-mannosidase
MKQIVLTLAYSFLFFNCFAQNTELSKQVNPFIGTGGHGHTFPGATVPFGMVQLSPDTRVDGSWDGCSGYHYSDSIIYGFSHTHLSGTGCSDYGDIMIMPIMGKPVFKPDKYASKFSHASEKANAGFYAVHLEDENIEVELTASTRAGFHKYTFNTTGKASIIIDLWHRDKLLDDTIRIVNDHCIEGYRRSEAWAKDQRVFFRIEFSNKFEQSVIGKKDGEKGKAAFIFKVKKGDTILVKVSLSSVDMIGAKKNMEAEIPHWNFEQTKLEAAELWNKELKKLTVKGGSQEQQTIFYTALYHAFLQPNIYNDVDGRYLGRDFKIHKAEGFNYYTVFSLWDTYRAAHPLYNLVQPERNLDFIKTFLEQYKQSGKLPMWELSSNETECMIGYHAASIMLDAISKRNNKFNIQEAIDAVLRNANNSKFGIPTFHQQSFLAVEDESESVSKTLEYAYDDWCISNLLLAGLASDTSGKNYSLSKEFQASSGGWRNLFNTQTGFIQPRRNGGWYAPFNPKEVNNHFTEANAWQYTFYVPHELEALIDAMGGPAKFEQKLDELFTTSSETTGREQADITGLIGQYAHGNEPSHHMAYLYNYIGKPEKTEFRINQILNTMYINSPDGLAGNEDCGQMSAWYVFSSMGFYPVCPGKNEYIKGIKPLFDEIYINNKKLEDLHLNITSYNYISENQIFNSAPIIEAAALTFRDSMQVSISGNGSLAPIYYALKDSSGNLNWQRYKKPFFIHHTSDLFANNAENPSQFSFKSQSKAHFHKIPHHWTVSIKSVYNKQYTAGGDEGLIDGIRGYLDWRKGGWQGYQGQNFEAVIDLKEIQTVSSVHSGFLQDMRSWILMPKEVLVETSVDGLNFKLMGNTTNTIADTAKHNILSNMEVNFAPTKARYIRVKAINYGKLPNWHPGAGGDAFIFIDEIEIK